MVSVVKLQHASIPMPAGGNDRARQFYGEKLGLTEKQVPESLAVDQLVWFELGDGGDELHVFTEDGEGRSPGQHICFQVDDIDALRARLASKGVEIEETVAIVNRPRFFIRDPFGNRVEVTQVLGDYRDVPTSNASSQGQGS